MIEVLRRVFQRSSDVLILQVWVIAQDFSPIITAGKLSSAGHADALAQSRPPNTCGMPRDTSNPARIMPLYQIWPS